MSTTSLATALNHLRREAERRSDRQLLEAYAAANDQDAFAALVGRHGSLVLGVCRSVLQDSHDAEDAFQATFLTLARSSGSIRKVEALTSWLHGVAYRIALRVKRDAGRRRNYERRAAARADSSGWEVGWRELQAVLDEEVQRLPPNYRAPFVLCCLEGLSKPEAAERLRIKEGTVSSRLTRARQRLQQRLARRGITLSAVLAALTVSGAGRATPPPPLVQATVAAACRLGAGMSVTGLSERALSHAEAVTPTLLITRTKLAAVLLVCALGLGMGLLAQPAPEEPPASPSSAPPARPKDQTLPVSGRVLDPNGKPVAGARLYSPGRSRGEITLVRRGITDKDGRFTLRLPRTDGRRDGPAVLLAAADAFGLDWVELPSGGAAKDVTLRLVKDVPVSGRIVSTEGKPIPGVTVNVATVIVPAKLDDILAALPRGNRAVETMSAKQLTLSLNTALRVTVSDKDGRFEIAGAGGERLLYLTAKHPALAASMFLVVTRQGLDVKAINRAIAATGRSAEVPLLGPSFEHVAEPNRLIEGTVREAGTGKPVAGATVGVYGNMGTALSDAHGRYRLSGLHKSQRYTLRITPPRDTLLIGRTVRVAEGLARLEPLRADVELPRGVIVTGRVLDKATGKGVESLITFIPLPANPFAKKAPRDLVLNTATDREGRFRLVTLPGPGVLLAGVIGKRPTKKGVRLYPYPINVYKPAEFDAEDRKRVQGFGTDVSFFHACKVVDVKPDGTATCNLTVDPGITVTVSLEDPEGKPLAGVIAAGITAESLGAFKQENATCTVYALDSDKPRQLVLLHRERKVAAVVTLRGDKGPRSVRLQPTGVITGRVLDTEGQPLAGAYVAALYRGWAGRNLVKELHRLSEPPRTDANGRFRLEGIVPGLEFDLGLARGRQRLRLEPLPALKPVEAGKTLELGDLKARTEAK
jgi:RNA polymerase sigma factor (sigma-70 family)